MEPEEYQRIRAHADTHWWYRSLASMFRSVVAQLPADARILDAGCGTGFLSRACPDRAIVGVDPSPDARAAWPTDAVPRTAAADLTALPFPDHTFAAVACLDVIYHARVPSDAAALAEIARTLAPGGVCLLQVCALGWLESDHDRAVHGVRRYRKAEVAGLVRDAGLTVDLIAYRNKITVLPILISRLIRRGGSHLGRLPRLLNGFLLAQSLLEWRLLRWRLPVPFGSSVVCVARRPAE